MTETPKARPTPPANLDVEGTELWASITKVHELGPEGLRLLKDACREADLIERLEDQLRTASLISIGSQKQEVASPLMTEVRQHRATLANLLKSMRLPLTVEEARTREQDISEKARKAASARWHPTIVGGAAANGR